jgi:hypothetical protein
MRRRQVHTVFWSGKLRERDHLEDQSVDGRIILKWIFKKWDEGTWIGLIWLRIGKAAGACERLNEPSFSIKCVEFID